jgi:hypothetical protein
VNPTAGFANLDQLIAFAGALSCAIIAFIPDSSDRENLSRNRRIFWGATAAAMTFTLLGLLPDWKYGLGAAFAIAALFAFRAFRNTPYIKVRGKIYAAQRSDRLAETVPDNSDSGHDSIPDSYTGSSTANETWWMTIVAYAICMFVIYGDFIAHHIHFAGIPAVIIFMYVPLYFGYWDACWGYPIARGQLLQLAILTVMTAGIFGALYFPGFYAGRRWPRRLKRSMEYRIHPRHWERDNGDSP